MRAIGVKLRIITDKKKNELKVVENNLIELNGK